MKKIKTFSRVGIVCELLLITILSLTTLVLSANAQNKFEGIITFNIETAGLKTQTMAYYLKGNKVRMEMKGNNKISMISPVIIVDNDSKTMYTLLSQAKSYMQVPMKLEEDDEDSTINDKDMIPHKTGKTEKIAGVECVEWRAKTREGSMELWNAKGFGNFLFVQNKGLLNHRNQSAWARDIMKDGFFPFRIINRDHSGHVKMKMEVTDVVRKNLDTSLFEIPSGYKKMDLPGLPGTH